MKTDNNIVEFFKQQIGKVVTNSPSPAGIWLGGILREVEEGWLVVDFEVRKEMTNPAEMLHGGMTALIADEMIGATIATLDRPNFYVSVSLNTEFLYGVKKGETVTAETEIIRKGKNVINTECKIYNKDKKLVAKASSNNVLNKKL